jgi:hypothetical protein
MAREAERPLPSQTDGLATCDFPVIIPGDFQIITTSRNGEKPFDIIAL